MIETVRVQERERLATKLREIRERNVALDDTLINQVAAIIREVRERGDEALIDYTARFDGFVLEPDCLRISQEALHRAAMKTDLEVVVALREAIRRVRAFHEFELQHSWEVDTEDGVRLGQRISPIDRAGVYIPGGTAGYPSSVVMNVVPAQIAGVKRIVAVTPPRSLEQNPAVAAVMLELGVSEVYGIGGAQAIAALAYGTESIPHVDKITGPGNKYVAAAKKLVFGVVGIDSLAGPSELVIIADESACASFVASDLLAQAEHGEDASVILITTSETLAIAVAGEVESQAGDLARRPVIEKSLAQYGVIVIVEDLLQASALVNDLAPEHLEIMARSEEVENEIASKVQHAGAIFFGGQTPAAAGDYLAGPNHVLPTSGAARFSSALSVHDFLKRTSTLRFSGSQLRGAASHIAALARAEGLEAHARSALIRLQEK